MTSSKIPFSVGAVLALAGAVAPAFAADKATNPLYTALGAPENWKITGSFRTRIEGIDGQFRPTAAEDDAFLSMRTMVFAEYDTGPVRIGAEIMDSRGYLQRRTSSVATTEINVVEPIQAYLGFDLGAAFGAGSTTTVTAGRFTQDVGSRRLVSRQVFRNNTNAYAGVKLDTQMANKDRLILFWTMPQVRLPRTPEGIRHNSFALDRQTTDLQLYAGSFTKAGVFGGTAEIYAYGLTERDAPDYPTRNRRLLTPGARLARAPKQDGYDYDLEGIYQRGRARATTAETDLGDLPVSAWFVHAEVGRTFPGRWAPRVALQYDRASGDGSNPATYNRFDTLYGARRFEYGPTSLYGAIVRANLSSPGVRVEVVPDKRLDAYVMYRALWLASASDSFSATDIRDKAGRSGTFAGHQVEGRIRYWLVPKIARLETGFAWLGKASFLKHAPNAAYDDDTRYVYTDLTFTF